MSDASDGLKRFISGYTAKSADKKFHMPYQRKDLALDLVKIHDDRFSSLGGDKYFACVDMKGTDGKIYDIDFLMAVQPGKLTVTQTSVHKINGKPLTTGKKTRAFGRKCVFRRAKRPVLRRLRCSHDAMWRICLAPTARYSYQPGATPQVSWSEIHQR